MINREAGLLEIKERLKANHVAIGLITFKRNPTHRLRDEDFPYIIMQEGTDQIITPGSRRNHGYPARRVCEVILEVGINDNGETDLVNLIGEVRRVIFTKRDTTPPEFTSIVAENTFFNENRTEGPSGVDVPDILVMRLVLDLVYTDNAFLS